MDLSMEKMYELEKSRVEKEIETGQRMCFTTGLLLHCYWSDNQDSKLTLI